MSHILLAVRHERHSIATETIFWVLAVLSVGAALAMILVRQGGALRDACSPW